MSTLGSLPLARDQSSLSMQKPMLIWTNSAGIPQSQST